MPLFEEDDLDLIDFKTVNMRESQRYDHILKAYNFYRDDPVFEAHRSRDNEEVLSAIEEKLEEFLFEAENGFRDLSRNGQKKLIEERQNEAEIMLRCGSFYPDEMEKYREEIKQKVENLYIPFIKWSRKKSKSPN